MNLEKAFIKHCIEKKFLDNKRQLHNVILLDKFYSRNKKNFFTLPWSGPQVKDSFSHELRCTLVCCSLYYTRYLLVNFSSPMDSWFLHGIYPISPLKYLLNMKHIFISNPFRSGSALTSRMLNAHSLVGMTVDKLTNKISKNSVFMVSCQN